MTEEIGATVYVNSRKSRADVVDIQSSGDLSVGKIFINGDEVQVTRNARSFGAWVASIDRRNTYRNKGDR